MRGVRKEVNRSRKNKWRDGIATLLPLVKKGRAGGRENENGREIRGKRRNVPRRGG